MIKSIFIFILLLSSFASRSQEVEIDSITRYNDVSEIPDPKLDPETGYVSNPDGIINEADIERINQVLEHLKKVDSFQVAVVAVNSIGDNVLEDFAADLFELWAIGNAERDDGLLVLFVNDQRGIKFETGYGMSTLLSDTRCHEIQQEFMIPAFKRGEYSNGLKLGVIQIISKLENKKIESVDPKLRD